MSLRDQMDITCPKCNTDQKMIYHQSINVTLEPDLKDELLEGKINVHFCESCGQGIDANSQLLYHDMSKALLLQFTRVESEDEIAEQLRALNNSDIAVDMPNYIKRLVVSDYDLIEKIRIRDADLADEVIELCKAVLFADFQSRHERVPQALLFHRIDGENLEFALFDEAAEPMAAGFPLEMYEKCGSDLRDRDPAVLRNGEWLHLDLHFALEHLMPEKS